MSILDLSNLEVKVSEIHHNIPPALLYEHAIQYDRGSQITSSGALTALSGEKTGRSPKDKRIVRESSTEKDIWWGEVNIPLEDKTFAINKERAIDYLNTLPRLYVVDAFAGWDPKERLKIRIICTRPYHALFMHNMLIRPTVDELKNFGKPDFVIINAGHFPANQNTPGMTSKTSVSLNFKTKEFVILGTDYAGEMKKGVFTILNYLAPKKGDLSMHCSANMGEKGDVALFFGLSGTGKTTLSAEPERKLIGDDEHVWTKDGISNIEGGCYAKCVNLSAANEPMIHKAIRFGALLENVVLNNETRLVDYENISITENTRCSYPIDYIDNAQIPCVGGHPKNIVFLTADAFGVLPPVSRLSPEQAMYHFISGYTAKVAGTEMGVKEPSATFSACFGAAFMVWHPQKYAEILAEKIKMHNCKVWLVNTGWSGGAYGTGKRISLKDTRSIIRAIHSGELEKNQFDTLSKLKLEIPKAISGVDAKILNPRETWNDKNAYDQSVDKLIGLFRTNFKKYENGCTPEVCSVNF